MELNEGVAVSAFSKSSDKCPMEPHSRKGFAGKPKGEKSVAELRKAMKAGQSTRQWNQTDTTKGNEKFEKAKNMDGPKQPEPDYGDDCITIAEVDYPLSIAAHHIIPGEASLPKSTIAEFLWKKEGTIRFDVGYDCDGSENGVWLPTHQIMSGHVLKAKKTIVHDDESPGRTKPAMSWEQLSDRAKANEGNAASYTELFIPKYTQQAMRLNNSQFHDSHSDYSSYVKKRLDELHTLIEKKSDDCEKCAGDDGKKSPPYMLVFRLNRLSAAIGRLLVGGPKKTWLQVYTSEFSCYYQRTPIPVRKLKQ